ncbi:MAG TPA: hypothetical protein VMF55_16910 [Solirubrobacterales bacterium]|nr:hypothetical protein [Solirubrobacterales bacterium]
MSNVSASAHTPNRCVRRNGRYAAKTANALRLVAIGVLAGLIVVGGALASVAGADQGGTPARGKIEVEPRFQIAGSHGYRILVSARLATVTIGVERNSTTRSGTSTTYVARGVSGPNGIHANFRQFGRVDLTFHATAAAVRGLPPDCFGGTTGAATIPGYFTGTLDFEGQGGYTAVHSRRVRGEVVLPPTEQCPLVAGGANPLLEDPAAELPPSKTRMTLSALYKAGTGGLLFVARREGKAGFYAERFGTVGRIGLLSIAYAVGPRSSFASNPQVSFGTVRPPAPFSGAATLRRGPGGKRSWTGTLAASFPGENPLSLVGPQFRTSLSRSFP